MYFYKDLDMAIQRCENNYIYGFNYFYNIYPFTTENISGYIDYFDLKDKSLLTVGSSCDQVLNAIIKGIKDVTLLDINPFVKYYYYLKVALILELDINEYMLFLRYRDYPKVFKDNKDVFKKDIFDKIKATLRVLDYESYLFWDDLFQMYLPIDVRKELFLQDENRDRIIKYCNPYLKNDVTFKQLKEKIKKVNPEFIASDIKDVNLVKKYDNIWLSNIFTNEYSFNEIKDICCNFNKYLNNNGMFLISYLYDTTINTKYCNDWSCIYNLDVIFDIFHEFDPDIKTFTGIKGILFEDDNYKRDSVLVYKKKM